MLKSRSGFTLIEIVLVLALAGFIIVIAFMAVLGTQRSRRDAQRKTDLGRIYGAIETYAADNRTAYPQTAQFNTFWTSPYITALNVRDPSTGTSYAVGGGWPANAAQGTVYYRLGFNCTGGAAPHGFSVKMGLENDQICRDLQ
jgi:prepilin-type N-terminal cleavage/methylation domain-containing protein